MVHHRGQNSFLIPSKCEIVVTSFGHYVASFQVLESVVEISSSKTGPDEEEEEEEPAPSGESFSLHGSLGPKYGGESELFYSQFDLSNRDSKISQIVLLKVSLSCCYTLLSLM